MYLSQRLSENRKILISGLFVFIITTSYFLSFALRFEFQVTGKQWLQFLYTLPLLIVIRLSFAHYFGLFRGWMGYAGVMDLLEIFKYNSLSSLTFTLLLVLIQAIPGFSRSVLVLDWTLNLFLVCFARFSKRIAREAVGYFRSGQDTDDKTHVLIVGAGESGIMIAREIINNPRLNYHPVGFIDDNDKKKDKSINGIPILGTSRDIKKIIEEKSIDEIIIAIPSAGSQRLKQLLDYCKHDNVKVKTTPSLSAVIDGVVLLSQVKEISIEDLIGRRPVYLDQVNISNEMKGKTVLITGAGGSIGSELARQVCHLGIKKLVLYERGENELYNLELNLKNLDPACKLVPIVGDILDKHRLREVMKRHRPDIVYHAAAYKHVPMMEYNPLEAVRNNLLGSLRVAQASVKYEVKKFIFVSSDKAVCPTSIMGATKRAAELALQTFKKTDTKFVSVRFGNVLGSRGSVVPLFKKQIAEGGPVTVTHPFIIRFFMSIPEACQLIIQAGVLGNGGELFVLDMGEPVRILDLAENVIRFAGYEPYKDIDIEFTGLRPGEKLYEELFYPWEKLLPTSHKKILRISACKIDSDKVKSCLAEIKKYLELNEREKTISVLKKMVPSFKGSYQNRCDYSKDEIKKDMEVNLKINDQEFKGKISEIKKGESIEIAVPQCLKTFQRPLTEKMEATFFLSPQNKVVRFYSSVLGSNNGSVPSFLTLEYPEFFEERDDMRSSQNRIEL